jgi:hypothetical protein
MSGVYKLLAGLHNGAGNFFANIFTYQLTEAGSGHPFDYAGALIDEWQSTNETDYLALMGSDVVLDFYQAKKVSGAGGPSASKARAANGGGFTSSISAQLAADVIWVTASSNNRFGHTYVGSIFEGALQQDFFSVGFIAAAATWIADMLPVMTLAGALGTATLGVYTRKTGTFNAALDGRLAQKATTMNKRALPRV